MALKIGGTTVANDTPNVAWSVIRANTIPPFVQTITINGSGTTTTRINSLPIFFSTNSKDSTPTGIFFKPDGTKMYVSGTFNDMVFEYGLSTAWNVATSTFTTGANVSVTTQTTNPQDIFFKSDGTKMYVIGQDATDQVYEYTLSTPWQVNSATFTTGANISVNSQETTSSGLFFSNTGNKMFIVGSAFDRVFEYSLSTPWQVNTATATAGANVSVTARDTTPSSLAFNEDGTIMYILGGTNRTVYQYSLSTAWQVNSATFGSINLVFSRISGSANGMAFGASGQYLYTLDTGGNVYHHVLETSYNVGSVGYPSIVFTRE